MGLSQAELGNLHHTQPLLARSSDRRTLGSGDQEEPTVKSESILLSKTEERKNGGEDRILRRNQKQHASGKIRSSQDTAFEKQDIFPNLALNSSVCNSLSGQNEVPSSTSSLLSPGPLHRVCLKYSLYLKF